MVTTVSVVTVCHHTKLLATFFLEHNFCLKEQISDKPWLFRIGHLADSFSKMSKGSLPVTGKQLRVFVANDKM